MTGNGPETGMTGRNSVPGDDRSDKKARPRTAAILLAAGRSRRHPGQSKLSRLLNGQQLGLHAAQTIVALAPIARIAVCSVGTQALAPDLTALGFDLAWNENPANGLSSSLAIGVQAARRHEIEAILVCLADMPFVSVGHLRSLLDRLDMAAGVQMVGSRAAGTDVVMPPAAFGGDAIDDLLRLHGDGGAKALLRQAVSVEVAPTDLTDFDDPETFEKFNGV